MSNKIGVLLVHGIGEQKEDYADEFIKNIKKRLTPKTVEKIDFEPVFWSSITEKKEDILQEKNKPFKLSWNFLRNFLIHYAGDALAYQRFCTKPGLYNQINKKICDGIENLEKRNGECPLVIISHSLGTVITQNYIWDRQNNKNKKFGKTKLQRMETLVSIITSGSPIPLFLLGIENPDPIVFPSKSVKDLYSPDMLNWLNFYDKDDIISFPLKPIIDSSFLWDIPVNVGNWLTSWNPLSHRYYWESNEVLEYVVEEFEKIAINI